MMHIQLEQIRFVDHISIPGFADTHINVNSPKTRDFTIWAVDMGVVIERPAMKDVLLPWHRVQNVVALLDIDWSCGQAKRSKVTETESTIADLGRAIALAPTPVEDPKPRKSRR